MIRLVVLAALLALPRSGEAETCTAEATALRTHLEHAQVATRRWNLGWTIGFGVAAAGQFTLAATKFNPLGEFDRNYEETLWVGGAKASIGFVSRFVFPLRVRIPEPEQDACSDLAALRTTAIKLAKQERQIFWLTHIGGTALNLAGMGLLWYRRSFKIGLTSFIISYPVGTASAYTLPRGTWKLVRAADWRIGIAPGRDEATGARTTLLTLGATW